MNPYRCQQRFRHSQCVDPCRKPISTRLCWRFQHEAVPVSFVTWHVSGGLGALALSPGQISANSLIEASTLADGTLYSDQVARKIGDLITIRVVETTTVQDAASTDLSRDADVNSAVTMVPGSDDVPPTPVLAGSGALPGIAWNSSKAFSGSGSYNRQGNLSTASPVALLMFLPMATLSSKGVALFHIITKIKL